MSTTVLPSAGLGSGGSGVVRAGTHAGLDVLDALLRGSVDYFVSATDRGATPFEMGLDALDWWNTAMCRDAPSWASPNRIVGDWPIARLRDFSTRAGARSDVVPTLILPPQAGHDSCIVDYAPGQSQVLTARAAGLSRIYSLDWVGATPATKDASIVDYLEVLRDAVERLGGRVNLVGDCQGGWLAVIYAALHPDTLHTLTIAGAPIDFHAGDALIHDCVQALAPGGDLSFYEAVVHANGGVLPGEFLLGGFMAMRPHGEVDRQLQLLAHLHDADYVQRYQRFERWFQHNQPIPGAFYLWIVEHLFQNNEMIRGELVVGEEVVDLARITCPLYLLAGASDHITPAEQVYALADHAGTPAGQVTQRLSNGGHLGLFMGHEALDLHWQSIFTQIAQTSRG